MERTNITQAHFVVNTQKLRMFVLVLRMITAVKSCVLCIFMFQLCIDREKTMSNLLKKPLNFKTTVLFYICSSVHRNSRMKKSNKMQQCADIYLLLNYSTYFGHPSRPSSRVHKTVAATSGIWGASFLKCDQISPYLVTFEEACFPDSMICTRGCNYSFMYSWWWARWTPETYRVI